jgi:hypothetical protein
MLNVSDGLAERGRRPVRTNPVQGCEIPWVRSRFRPSLYGEEFADVRVMLRKQRRIHGLSKP